jgi:tetratricopeptide (TPR) repeat protein
MSSSGASAQDPCEQAYRDARDAKRFPSRAAAIAHLESFKGRCSSNPLFLARLGRFYFESDRLDEAEAVVAAGLKLAPKDDALLFSHGDIKLKKSDIDGAKAAAARLMEWHPDSYAGPYLMQRALMDARQFREAIPFGDRAIALAKGSVPVLYLNNAVAAYHAEQDKLSVEYAEAAISRDPTVLRQAWGIDEAIYALDRSRRFNEALALAKRRKDADPNWRNDAALVKILKVMGVVQ